jgi:hypothetical protein
MDIHCKRTQGCALLRRAPKDRDDQWTQANADLHAQRASTGVNRIIEVRREKNMPMASSNIFKTFELQSDVSSLMDSYDINLRKIPCTKCILQAGTTLYLL